MRRQKIRHYDSIYARDKKRLVGRIVFIVIICALLFGAGWYLYQPIYDFITGTTMDNLKNQTNSSSTSDTGSSASDPGVAPTPEVDVAVAMAYAPPTALASTAALDSFLASLPKDSANTILIDLKNADGTVLYQSALPQVQQASAQGENAFTLAAITKHLHDAGYKVAGRIYAFKDNLAAYFITDAAVRYTGTQYSWLDNAPEAGGKAWLNPYSPQATTYLYALVDEALANGVDGIVLDAVHFPTGLSLQLTQYPGSENGVERSAILAQFVTEVSSKVKAASGLGCWVNIQSADILQPDTTPTAKYGANPSSIAAAAELLTEVLSQPLPTGE